MFISDKGIRATLRKWQALRRIKKAKRAFEQDRSVVHLEVGDDTSVPSAEDLAKIAQTFLVADIADIGVPVKAHVLSHIITNVEAGTDEWHPTAVELQELINIFESAAMDPLGSVVATRNGVRFFERNNHER